MRRRPFVQTPLFAILFVLGVPYVLICGLLAVGWITR